MVRIGAGEIGATTLGSSLSLANIVANIAEIGIVRIHAFSNLTKRGVHRGHPAKPLVDNCCLRFLIHLTPGRTRRSILVRILT